MFIVTIFKRLIASVMVFLSMLGILNYAAPEKSKDGAYLFAYFVGNAPEQERIHFAVSTDGYNFAALNGDNPVIKQNLGKQCVRDPYILKGQDGNYYIVGTDMKSEEGWVSNHALVTWKSEDLINWTDETIIDIRDFGGEFSGTSRAWAPQAIWDEDKGMYMVYWSHTTWENDSAAIYYAYTSDFKTITEPKYLFGRPGIQTIDGDIAYNKENGKYYLYFKFEESQTIAYVTSDKLTGPYCDEAVVVSLAPSGVEGSSIYNITGTDTWVMMMDEYGKGRFFAQQTTDFENFKPLPRYSYNYTANPRHGSIVPITMEEYDRLVNAFGVEGGFGC